MITAAERWTGSGANVADPRSSIAQRTPTWSSASTTAACCACAGATASATARRSGARSDGRSEVLLRSNLGGTPRPLSVWVAAHELGHVLGLHHRTGHAAR